MNTLYRFFTADDKLLYVGRSRNPARRFEKHANDKPWWENVARIQMEQRSSHVDLCEAEAQAIKTEKPLHNIRLNGSGTQRQTRAKVEDPRAEEDYDGLVGRWFHSWTPIAGSETKHATVRGDQMLEWQGQIIDQANADLYIVQTYSWFDGSENRSFTVTLDVIATFTLYTSAEKMQMALPCGETIGDWVCKRPCTHRSPMGYHCWKCAKYYTDAEDIR